MSHTKYQYVTPDSHTMIQVEPGEPKVKVSTWEIVSIDDSIYNRGRLIGAWFREMKGKTVVPAGNDAVVAENAEKKRIEEEEAEKAAKEQADLEKVGKEGAEVPKIEVPGGDAKILDNVEKKKEEEETK